MASAVHKDENNFITDENGINIFQNIVKMIQNDGKN